MTLPVVHAVVHQAARAYEARTPAGKRVIVIETEHSAPGQITRSVVPLPEHVALDLATDIEDCGW
ncbi:hypothetical protein [Streptomyces sp. FH025]|uniref:hypothetical protein n=1 Tax=Streptomyces sp. FH025 TaxID=2815937 RepID=UPI001A9FCDF2|nr:hypothetical protein [Streptomyces sp. FH025]MBO1418337.1 hypothetical protein [Streptomyces sp. FH025]